MKPCHYCGKPIDPDAEPCYQGVSGWEEHRRSGGGTHAITGRKPKDLWCCMVCIGKLKRGLSPGQQGL